jgi:hypothetical protein
MAQQTAQADPQRGRYWRLFLSGPVIYTIYFLSAWALGEFGCLAGIEQIDWLGQNPIYLGVLLLTAIAALLTIGAGIVAFRQWRELHEGAGDPDEDDPKFMLFVGTWLNGLFSVVILASAIPMLLGSACAWI